MAKSRGFKAETGPEEANRRRLENETGTVFKDRRGRISIALAYPNNYEVGMSNLGLQKIYRMFNNMENVVCERVFLPSVDEIAFIKKRGRRLSTMESNTALEHFDAIAFSITFEADYINVLKMLSLAGIPFAERGENSPLLIAGGICVTMNPEAMAPFFDVMVVGEGEDALAPIAETIVKHGKSDLREYAKIAGVYVPSGYNPVYNESGEIERFDVAEGFPQKVKRLWNHSFVTAPNKSEIHTGGTVFGALALVETGKGCGKHCRFCAAGYVYRPTRHAEKKALLAAIDEALAARGRVGLMGSAVGDHPDIEEIFAYIAERGGEFSVSSIRLDKLTTAMLQNLMKGGSHTITAAPEAGSEPLRTKINKVLSDETILNAVRLIAETGSFNLKLYFLVGLPGETMEDVEQIPALVKRIRETMEACGKAHGGAGKIIAGVDVFVPKPFTPFQREPFDGIKLAEKKLKLAAKGLRSIAGVEAQIGSGRQSYIQAALSVGDRRVAGIVLRAFELDGDWFRAFRESVVHPDFFAIRRKRADEVLPWDVVDSGLRPDYLDKEMERSLKGKTIAECPPPGAGCERCGSFTGVCIQPNEKL